MKIAIVFKKGRLRRLKKVMAGKAASDFFYGAKELQGRDHDIDIFEIENAPYGDRLFRKVSGAIADWLFARRLLPSRAYGGLLFKAKDLCSSLQSYDVVVATTTGIAFSLGLWRYLGYLKPPIVAIHCSLMNYQHNWFRRNLNGILLRRMWTQLYGDAEINGFCNTFNVPEDRVEVNQFGIDTNFWTPSKDNKRGEYILSIGNDGRRDYDLLMKVARKVDYKFLVVTFRDIKEEIPPNVTIKSGNWHSETLTDEHLRDLYRNSKFVVIPLKDSPQPSGQSVSLQAMACGKPVILTRTRGLWSEDIMKDGENVIFAPPNDPDIFAEKINDLLGSSEAIMRMGHRNREKVCKEASISGFAERLERVCKIALETSPG